MYKKMHKKMHEMVTSLWRINKCSQSYGDEREIRLVEAIIEFRPENFIDGITEVGGFLG